MRQIYTNVELNRFFERYNPGLGASLVSDPVFCSSCEEEIEDGWCDIHHPELPIYCDQCASEYLVLDPSHEVFTCDKCGDIFPRTEISEIFSEDAFCRECGEEEERQEEQQEEE